MVEVTVAQKPQVENNLNAQGCNAWQVCIAMFLLHWLAWPVHLTVNVCRRVSVTTIPTKPASQMPVTPHFNGKESTWFEESTHQQNFRNLPMKTTRKLRKGYI